MSIKKFINTIYLPKNETYEGRLFLSICLYLFIKSPNDTKENLWCKFCDSVKASCLGGTEVEQEESINYCMKKVGRTQENIDKMKESDFSAVIDEDYRNLFLPALYLRYHLMENGRIGDLGFKVMNPANEKSQRINPEIFNTIKDDVCYLVSVLPLDFEHFMEKLHIKSDQITKDTNSTIFGLSVAGFKRKFNKTPRFSTDFSVGYYLGISEVLS